MAIAIGQGAQTAQQQSIVIGATAKAITTNRDEASSVVVGFGSKTIGQQGTVLGSTSGASAQSVAVGGDVYAAGKSSIAIGNDDITDKRYQDKLPDGTITDIYQGLWSGTTPFITNTDFDRKYRNANSIYSPTYAAKLGAIAIGSRTVAGGEVSTALGSLAFALADRSTAVGIRSFVEKNAVGGTSIGEQSRVFAKNSVAIGNLTESSNAGTVSYGYKAYAVGQDSIAIGNNVAAATRVANPEIINAYGLDGNGNPISMDAVKDSVTSYFDTKFSTQKESTVYLTVGSEEIKKSTAQGANAIVLGNRSLALKENGVAVGYGSLVDAQNSISVGSYNYIKSGSDNTLVVGLNNRILGNSSQSQNNTVIGSGNVIGSATGDSLVLGSYGKLGQGSGASLVLGKGVTIGDDAYESIAFGQGVKIATGANRAVAIGVGASATVASSMALGNQSVASFANSVALGFQSRTDYTEKDYNTDPWTAEGAIATPTSSKTGVISVGSKGQERRITNVASGALNTDAVNVSQLKTIEDKFKTEISALKQGGGSQYLSIERQHTTGKAGDLAAKIAKTDNYQDYVEMRTQLAYLKARKEVNGEEFDTTSYDNYAQAVDELGALYDGAVANTATELAKTDQAIVDARSQLNGLQGDALEAKRAELMQSLQTKIANAQAADAGKTMAGALSAAEAEAAKKDTNINNDGALGDDSVALGWKATTGRRIGVNEFGTLATQFVRNTNGAVDNGKVGNRSIAIGFEAQANGKNAIAIGGTEDGTGDGINPNRNIATGDNSIAVGTGNTVTGSKAIAIGYGHKVTAAGSGAFGDPSIINYSNSYAVGNNNTIGTSGSTEAQPDAEVGSFVLGNNVTVTADQVFVLGNGTSTNKLAADTARSVYLGDNTVAIASGTISAGKTDSYASVTSISPFTFGSFAGATPVGVVTIGSTTESRRLQGVAAGLIGATSTDAINGSQLYATNAVLGKLASSVKDKFGGNAALTDSGADAGTLTFTNIGGTGKATIDEAIKAVKASVAGTAPITVSSQSDNTGATTYTVSLADGGVTTDKLADDAVTADKLADNAVTSGNIADGAIAESDLSTEVKNKLDAGNNAASHTIALGGNTDTTTAKSLKEGNITFNIKGSNGITTKASGDDITISIDASALPTNPNGGGTGAAHWFNVKTTNTTDTNYDSTNSGAKGTDSIAVGRNVVANGGGTIAIGSDITSESNASTGATNAIVMGVGAGTPLRASAAEKLGAYSIAIGSNAYATQQGASAIGWAASATDIGATALGTRAAASGNKSLAGGFNAQASGASSVALGDTAKATADYSVALGSGSIAGDVNKGTNASSFAMGDGAVAAGSPLLDDNKVAVLSVGNSGGTSVKYRQIQNVAAGVISETSTDAINGSQLYFTNQAVTAAKSAADTAKSAADAAQSTANTAQSTAEAAKTAVDGLALSFETDSTNATGSVKLIGDDKQTLSVKGTENFVTTSSTAGGQGITIDLAESVKTKLNNLASNPNETYASKDDLKDISGTLNFTGDASSEGSVGLKEQKLAINGTANQIETTASGQSLTIKLADAITNNLAKLDNVEGDLNEALSNKADTSLSNLTDAGKQVINDQIKVVKAEGASDALTIETSGGSNGTEKTYTIGLTDAAIKQAAGTSDLEATYAKVDGSNITTATTWSNHLQGITYTGDNSTSTDEKKLGSTIAITGGATGEATDGNIKVTADTSSGLKLQLAKALNGLTSATFTDGTNTTTVNGSGITAGDVSLTNAGLNNGGNKITNLANGVADNDAATMGQLKGAAFNLAGDTTTGTPTVKAKDGTLTIKGTTNFVTTTANTDGFTVDLAADLKTKLNNLPANVQGALDGKAGKDGTNIDADAWRNALGAIAFAGDDNSLISKKLGERLNIKGGADGDVTTGNIKVSSSNNELLVQLAKNLTGLGTVTADTVTATNSLVLGSGDNAATITADTSGIDFGGKKLTNLAEGDLSSTSKDAVTGAQLQAVKDLITTAAGTSIQYAADNTDTGAAKTVSLGTGLTFNGDSNIKTTAEDGGKVKFALNPILSGLTSAAFGDNTSGSLNINNSGITITPTTGSAVSLTSNGLNNGGNKITNVGDGTISENSTDAVNAGQLWTVQQSVGNKANADQTIKLVADTNVTAAQTLKKEGGISFTLKGDNDITTKVTNNDVGNTVNFALNKADTVASGDTKVITSSAVYDAIVGAKTTVSAAAGDDNLLTVTPTAGATGLNPNNYTLGVSKSAIQSLISSSGNITFKDGASGSAVVGLGQSLKVVGQSGWVNTEVSTIDGVPTLTIKADSQGITTTLDQYFQDHNYESAPITYKANGQNADTVSLVQGLDFHGDTTATSSSTANKNIIVSVDGQANNDGIVNFTLADDLKGVNSISGSPSASAGDTDDSAKITLKSKGDNGGTAAVDVNGAKVTNLADGQIADNSKDAVTGKQLADLADQLGVSPNTDGTGFDTPNLTAINNDTPSSVVDAVNKLATAANGGLNFDADNTSPKSVALGKKVSVVSGDLTGDFAGTNLKTQITEEGGNAKITIGMSSKPNFDSVTVGNAAGTANTGITLSSDSGSLKLGSGANAASAVKLTNLAAGTIGENSTDAVNGKQIKAIADSVKNMLGSDFTVGADGAISHTGATIGGVTSNDIGSAISALNDKISTAANGNIKYKATNGTSSSETPQTVALGTGFNFTGGKNTDAKVGANGVVTFDLKPELTGVQSITGATGDGIVTPAKITLKGSTAAGTVPQVSVNNAKVTDVAAGNIATDSKDAITGAQMKELADKLGITTSGGTGFNTPTFDQIAGNTAPTTVKGAIDQLITATNGGMKFGADSGTVATVALSKQVDVKSGDINVGGVNYKGANLETKVTAATDTANAKIEIGLSEKPNFNTVTVGSADGTAAGGITLGKDDSGNLKLGKGDNGTDSVVLTNLAAGSLADGSKDAVTGDQLRGALETLATTVGGGAAVGTDGTFTTPTNIGGTGKNNLNDAIQAAYDKANGALTADSATLAYTANGAAKKSTKLSDGLNFTNGTNTTAEVDNNGVVKFNVNPALTGITSISGSGTTLTLGNNGLSLNNQTISGVKDGVVSATSTEAVNGKQLNALANKLGATGYDSTNGTFTTPALNPIGSSTTAPSNVVDAVNQLATASKKGLAFVADDGTAQEMPLGSKVSVLTTASKTVNNTTFVGDNLYSWMSTNGLMNIGFSQTPFFTNVVIGGSAVSGGITLAKDGDKLKVGSGTDGATAVQLTNIKAGAIGDNSTDAINGTQLQSLLKVLGGLTVDPNTNLVKAPTSTPSADNKGGIGGTGATTVEGAIKTIAEQAKANAANSQLTLRANSKDTDKQTVALSQGLDFVDGTNTTASISGTGKVTVDLNKDLKNITSISSGTDDSATKISLGKDEQGNKQVDLNGAKLTGLGKGSVSEGSKDAVTGGQLYEVQQSVDTLSGGVNTVKEDVSKLSDTVNKGIQITTNDAAAKKVEMGNTINVKDGVNTKVSAIESKDGMFSYSINVNGIPMSYVNSQGETLAKIGDAFVVVNPDGSLVTDLDMSKPENVARVKPAGVKLVNTAEANKPMTLDNVANGSISSGSQQAVNGGQVADLVGAKVAEVDDGQGGKKTVIVGDDGKGVGSTGAKTISEAVKVVNDKATNAETVANEAKEIAKNANVTDIVGDTDSGVIVEKKDNATGKGKSYTVKLGNKVKTKEVEADKVTAKEVVADKVSAKQVDTDLITLGGGKVSMIAGEDDDGVSVLAVGSEKAPTRIRGIADGVAPTDAVNMRQFGEVTNRLGKQINKVSRTANAGIAGAMAMTGLPQAVDPGASMVSMAGSSFKGESAMAFGVSRRSDNGKFVLKANGSVNSQGDTGVTVGVGYQWR